MLKSSPFRAVVREKRRVLLQRSCHCNCVAPAQKHIHRCPLCRRGFSNRTSSEAKERRKLILPYEKEKRAMHSFESWGVSYGNDTILGILKNEPSILPQNR